MGRMRIDISHSLDRLLADYEGASRRLAEGLDDAVKSAAREGNAIAKEYARKSAGAHGRKYPGTFRAARLGAADFVYGPTGTEQGDMSFEGGSRNQPPHNDLAKSQDRIRQGFVASVREAIDDALD